MAESHTTDVSHSVPEEIAEIAREANADYVDRSGSMPDQYYLGFGDLEKAKSVTGRDDDPVDIIQIVPRKSGISVVITESE